MAEASTEQNPKQHFRHLIVTEGKRTRRVTLCYEWKRTEGGEAVGIWYGYSVCNPKDSFNRKLARTISLGRFVNPRTKSYKTLLAPLSKENYSDTLKDLARVVLYEAEANAPWNRHGQ